MVSGFVSSVDLRVGSFLYFFVKTKNKKTKNKKQKTKNKKQETKKQKNKKQKTKQKKHKSDEVHPIVETTHAPGGTTLSDHVMNKKVHELLSSRKFDIYVLQDQSQVPGIPYLRDKSIESIEKHFITMMVATKRARIILFETWGKKIF